jgi:WD repeat-containing protein 19
MIIYYKNNRFYALCGMYSRALRLFLQCGDKEIDAAIEVVGKSGNESLTHQLIDFLVGEKDGVPKDPNYIYRLYLALKKYEDAAKTALIIARQEQDLGNYTMAHQVIIEIIRYLEDASIKVSLQLRANFVLLHSYQLIKHYVKHRQDHIQAARLLLRVVQSVSKFPMHVVPLLTSTVIECQRAGYKTAAYEYAVMLVRPEYRSQLDSTIKRKIEAIVRRKSQYTSNNNHNNTTTHSGEGGADGTSNNNNLEEMSLCPISAQLIPVMQLECPTTRDALPMCIISGKHMVIDDWCFCPISKFPALYSEYYNYIKQEAIRLNSGNETTSSPQTDDSPTNNNNKNSIKKEILHSISVPDPIYGKSVTLQDLTLATRDEAMLYIQRYNNVIDKKETKDGTSNNNNNNNSPNSKEGEKSSINNNNDKEDGPSNNSNKNNRDEDDNNNNSPRGNYQDPDLSPIPGKSQKKPGATQNNNNNNSTNNKNLRIASKSKMERINRSKKKRSTQGSGSNNNNNMLNSPMQDNSK